MWIVNLLRLSLLLGLYFINQTNIKIDENALQSNNLNLKFNNNYVKLSDNYSNSLETLDFINYSDFIYDTLYQNNLEAHHYKNSIYTTLKAPKSSNKEAILIHSPFTSQLDSDFSLKYDNNNVVNVRAISILLSLLKYFNSQAIWSKDLLFFFGDDLDTFLYDYMNGHINNIPKNNIWIGYTLDYPSDSFSHLEINYVHPLIQPNFDVIASLYSIGRHNNIEIRSPALLETYRHSIMDNTTSNYHSTMLNYKIDAITINCIPNNGPHGFLSLGRLLEGYTRSFNNLIERLHASLSFYLFFDNKLIKLSDYIPIIIIASLINIIQAFEKFEISSKDAITITLVGYITNTFLNPQISIILSTFILRFITNRTSYKLLTTLIMIYTSLYNFYVSLSVALMSTLI